MQGDIMETNLSNTPINLLSGAFSKILLLFTGIWNFFNPNQKSKYTSFAEELKNIEENIKNTVNRIGLSTIETEFFTSVIGNREISENQKQQIKDNKLDLVYTLQRILIIELDNCIKSNKSIMVTKLDQLLNKNILKEIIALKKEQINKNLENCFLPIIKVALRLKIKTFLHHKFLPLARELNIANLESELLHSATLVELKDKIQKMINSIHNIDKTPHESSLSTYEYYRNFLVHSLPGHKKLRHTLEKCLHFVEIFLQNSTVKHVEPNIFADNESYATNKDEVGQTTEIKYSDKPPSISSKIRKQTSMSNNMSNFF